MSLQKTTSSVNYSVNGKTYALSLVTFKPAKPTSLMYSYVAAEQVSCEEKKMSFNSGESNAYPVWTMTTFRRVVVNRTTEYKCLQGD